MGVESVCVLVKRLILLVGGIVITGDNTNKHSLNQYIYNKAPLFLRSHRHIFLPFSFLQKPNKQTSPILLLLLCSKLGSGLSSEMASFAVPCPKAASTSLARIRVAPTHSRPNASLSFGFQGRSNRIQTQPNKVTVMAVSSSNSVAIPAAKPVVDSPEVKGESSEETLPGNRVPDQQSIIAFMDQVSDLVKLVDSRDIVELQLKQLDCELLIRKKEAVEQPAAQIQYAPMQHPLPPAMYASPPPPPQVAPVVAPAAASTPQSAPSNAVKSSHPPLMCPMAGTLYRSPGPGEPPFVKVGDKVQKGQVICIIEAMKLMNEIEADQSGTITEVLMDDGKPVSVGTPLFVIAP